MQRIYYGFWNRDTIRKNEREFYMSYLIIFVSMPLNKSMIDPSTTLLFFEKKTMPKMK